MEKDRQKGSSEIYQMDQGYNVEMQGATRARFEKKTRLMFEILVYS